MMPLLIKYWRPLAVFLLLLMTWLHGHHSGATGERKKWELITAKQMSVQAQAMFKNSEHARKVEQDWAAAFDAAATISHEELTHVQSHRDRLLADLRAGRVSFKPASCPMPEAPADSGQPQAATSTGQPGLAGEELVGRLATCDEVTLERNQAVRLLEAERQ